MSIDLNELQERVAKAGRPLPEMAESVAAVCEKAAAMLDEIRAGLIWSILTYKLKET
jgi:hypothetical protein